MYRPHQYNTHFFKWNKGQDNELNDCLFIFIISGDIENKYDAKDNY